MQSSNDDDDPGGWRSFLRKLMTTSVIDDCWGANYALVANNFSDDSRCSDLGRTPSVRTNLVDKPSDTKRTKRIT